MQRALAFVYPEQCVLCDALVEGHRGLCGSCWRDTPFVTGAVCASCGVPVPGEPGPGIACDDCLARPRPWVEGRAALVYRGTARRIVLSLKHSDRLDLAPSAASWMIRAAGPLLARRPLLVPVPSHWLRLIRRRYNQAAVLAGAIARQAGLEAAPRALVRIRATKPQDGMGAAGRFANVDAAIAPHPVHGAVLSGRDVLLVDDVLTSGATLAAASEACYAAGAARIDVVTLARVARDA